MKKIQTLVKLSAIILLALLYSCEKTKIDKFQELKVVNLRENNPSSSIKIIDVTSQIIAVNFPGPPAVTFNDTLGLTKVLCENEIIYSSDWKVGYQSQFHYKTSIYGANSETIQIVFVRDDIFFNKLLLVQNNKLLKTIDYSTVTIKKVKIDESERAIRITGNSTWIRTGPIEDVETNISY